MYRLLIRIKQRREFKIWEKKGNPVPPPFLAKQRILEEFAKKFSLSIFIESGTYMGDMIFALKELFNQIFSIELNNNLYRRAKKRFSKFPHITILLGDSAELLPDVLSKVTKPCFFWLDAHYSGGITAKGNKETPIMEEIINIFSHSIKNHVILIDDARCFIGKNDYPALKELKKFVYENYPNSEFVIKDDIIRIFKK